MLRAILYPFHLLFFYILTFILAAFHIRSPDMQPRAARMITQRPPLFSISPKSSLSNEENIYPIS